MKTYPLWHPFTQMKTSMPKMKVTSANGLYLKLENGKKLMDLISSWWVTLHGHGNKVIAKAIYEQALILEQVIFANFQHDPAIKLAEKLKKNLPNKLNHFFFSDNGSTAVEVALKMAYQHWKNQGENRNLIIAFEGAYHGDTLGAMSVRALAKIS